MGIFMIILHVWKEGIRGSYRVEDYFLVQPETEDVYYDIAEQWAYNERGVGNEYGYTYGWEIVATIPENVLKTKIQVAQARLDTLTKEIEFLHGINRN